MRVPQVNERVKEAPAQALRAMFAGVGQLLLFTDKLRNRGETDEKKAPEAASTSSATATETKPDAEAAATAAAPAETVPAAEAKATTHAAPTAETVNGQAATTPAAPATEVTEKPAKAPATPRAAKAPAAPKAAAPKAAAPKAAAAATTEAAELPLPNYDGLTVASLRARMRNLTADQLTVLIGYEKAHANREDVIGMFERRIAKLSED
jgi:hypothetical protein